MTQIPKVAETINSAGKVFNRGQGKKPFFQISGGPEEFLQPQLSPSGGL